MKMQIKGLNYSYDKINGVRNINMHVDDGEFVGIIGPNGSGKSTVLKNIYRALTPDSGDIFLDGESILKMSYKKTAVKMAVVGQENELLFDFSAEEIAAMGRSPHKKLFEIDNERDRYMTHHALEHLGISDLAKRSYQSLSGGEKQRVLLARAIAQESDFFILDEPSNHLDISYQIQLFDLIKRLKVTALSAMHDLNIAALYCDRIYVLKNGEIFLSGTPEDVLTSENILDVYGVRSIVEKNNITKRPVITFIPAAADFI